MPVNAHGIICDCECLQQWVCQVWKEGSDLCVFLFQWLGSVSLSPVTVTGSAWPWSSILQRGCEHPAPHPLLVQMPWEGEGEQWFWEGDAREGSCALQIENSNSGLEDNIRAILKQQSKDRRWFLFLIDTGCLMGTACSHFRRPMAACALQASETFIDWFLWSTGLHILPSHPARAILALSK